MINEDTDEHVATITVERNEETILHTEATLAATGNNMDSRFYYNEFPSEPAAYRLEIVLENGSSQSLSPRFTASECPKNYNSFIREGGRLSSFYSEANC